MSEATPRGFGLACIALLALCGCTTASASTGDKDARWISLFNGKDLAGWSSKGGAAPYEVRDGVIVGTAVPNSPNSFLVSNLEFDDFVLELEIKVEGSLNSGIMFRAASTPDYLAGKVHGYQMEADGSDRRWSGGIFEEAMRGWLYPVTRNEPCSMADRRGEWNAYRIEAIGNRLQTFVNGIPCARLVDQGRTSGFIGLQVHGVGGNPDLGKPGDTASWRNIRIRKASDGARLTPLAASVLEINTRPNELTDWEKAQGFSLLWDGKTMDGWRGTKSAEFPTEGWQVAEGMISAIPIAADQPGPPEDVLTDRKFSDFELELEFRFAEGANSGVKYFLDQDLLAREGKPIGLEFQILDDERHPDANKGVAGKRRLASLYDLIRADNLSEANRNEKRANPAGEWNHLRIVSQGGKVEHWLNHVKVVEYDRLSQEFAALVEYSKYQGIPNFGRHESGPVLLQHHGGGVDFRSIKIRELSGN